MSSTQEQITRPTILIIEDHEVVRASLRDWLKATFPDCSFLEAKSGEEAIALAFAQRPQLILMDLRLHKMDGLEATRRIKAAMPQVKVVILTIFEDAGIRAEAVKAGADVFLPKRRMHAELIPLVADLLSRPGDAGFGSDPSRTQPSADYDPGREAT
ncbi:MAG: response regulator transcription factor [candidate division NC10 bacterium]|nr:response regulator transcription factor [candidate division NC10 bacterium]